jgi:hypothetical protein
MPCNPSFEYLALDLDMFGELEVEAKLRVGQKGALLLCHKLSMEWKINLVLDMQFWM